MPCLEEADLSLLAQQHIKAQQANIKNQRDRLSEIQAELQKLKSDPDADPLKITEAEKAIADLEYHLNGKTSRAKLQAEADQLRASGLKPDRLKRLDQALKADGDLIKDPDLDTAEDRAKVMEALYTQRQQLVFRDTAFDGGERTASIFGAPTVKNMKEIGEDAIAQDLMLRSISLVMGRNDTKNPNDYLDPKGLEVKTSLSDGIEHHHIYNNVYVDENGRVKPNSVRFYVNPKTGDVEMEVIPEYWNSSKHGKNTQFVELLDGAHSGNDPTTHLHYYKFNDTESVDIRAKISEKIKEINSQNASRLVKLDRELQELRDRKNDPQAYENKLKTEISDYDSQISDALEIERKYTTENAKGVRVKNRGLTPDQEQELQKAREKRKALESSRDKVQKSLEEHRTFVNLESDIQQWKSQKASLDAQFNAIKLNARFPDANGFPDKDSARKAKEQLKNQLDDLTARIKTSEQLLRDKGSLDQQIRDKELKRTEAQKLANLTEDEALAIYERTNGFFSFDKGHQESQDYSKSRPKMNSEIHKYNARQAIEVLEREHGDNALAVLRQMAENSYKRNLLYNTEVLVEKVAGTLI
ncbi:hypothetical protein [Fischerella thermalis]|uniref:hypothetical protein n=3 Tax=Fischerella thermalis TaxID=372787 RepID=UPI000C7FFD18|nr:hypothetical protein [Fischerella thermalis]PLZ11279.1 hypothetical protein CBP19_13160 [Fischerella thermalis WC1110]PLZ41826.1 hypothetical protein CBP26_08755 [Fischerella thermalis WC538]PLZ44065.1 hypothetical protein CBP25_11100 [Fischerella thermalis WC527]RDH49771.1 hypothetical protein CA946_09770 [Fischerella thermalis 111/344/542]